MTRLTDTFWSLYVLRCGDGTLYAGVSPDVARRLATHRAGQGARYLRGRGPLQLVATTSVGTRAEALRAEHAFKRLTKARKEAVIGAAAGLQRFVASCQVAADSSLAGASA